MRDCLYRVVRNLIAGTPIATNIADLAKAFRVTLRRIVMACTRRGKLPVLGHAGRADKVLQVGERPKSFNIRTSRKSRPWRVARPIEKECVV